MAHMRIIYYSTLYHRESVKNVFGDINFGMNGGAFGATFKSGGNEYFIEAKNIIKIEEVKEDK